MITKKSKNKNNIKKIKMLIFYVTPLNFSKIVKKYKIMYLIVENELVTVNTSRHQGLYLKVVTLIKTGSKHRV